MNLETVKAKFATLIEEWQTIRKDKTHLLAAADAAKAADATKDTNTETKLENMKKEIAFALTLIAAQPAADSKDALTARKTYKSVVDCKATDAAFFKLLLLDATTKANILKLQTWKTALLGGGGDGDKDEDVPESEFVGVIRGWITQILTDLESIKSDYTDGAFDFATAAKKLPSFLTKENGGSNYPIVGKLAVAIQVAARPTTTLSSCADACIAALGNFDDTYLSIEYKDGKQKYYGNKALTASAVITNTLPTRTDFHNALVAGCAECKLIPKPQPIQPISPQHLTSLSTQLSTWANTSKADLNEVLREYNKAAIINTTELVAVLGATPTPSLCTGLVGEMTAENVIKQLIANISEYSNNQQNYAYCEKLAKTHDLVNVDLLSMMPKDTGWAAFIKMGDINQLNPKFIEFVQAAQTKVVSELEATNTKDTMLIDVMGWQASLRDSLKSVSCRPLCNSILTALSSIQAPITVAQLRKQTSNAIRSHWGTALSEASQNSWQIEPNALLPSGMQLLAPILDNSKSISLDSFLKADDTWVVALPPMLDSMGLTWKDSQQLNGAKFKANMAELFSSKILGYALLSDVIYANQFKNTVDSLAANKTFTWGQLKTEWSKIVNAGATIEKALEKFFYETLLKNANFDDIKYYAEIWHSYLPTAEMFKQAFMNSQHIVKAKPTPTSKDLLYIKIQGKNALVNLEHQIDLYFNMAGFFQFNEKGESVKYCKIADLNNEKSRVSGNGISITVLSATAIAPKASSGGLTQEIEIRLGLQGAITYEHSDTDGSWSFTGGASGQVKIVNVEGSVGYNTPTKTKTVSTTVQYSHIVTFTRTLNYTPNAAGNIGVSLGNGESTTTTKGSPFAEKNFQLSLGTTLIQLN